MTIVNYVQELDDAQHEKYRKQQIKQKKLGPY